jgi:hypothetical protein
MLHIRSIAVSAAVLGFFALGIIGSVCGVSPCTCSKRAVLGAAAAYLAAGVAARAINAILTQAMIESRIDRENLGETEG